MTHSRNISRRSFTLIAGAAGLASLVRAQRKIPIAVQLYSVRTLCAADMPGTIAGVAKLGYQAVEFAGYYGHTATELRKMLDDSGLKCCGTHLHIDALLVDSLQKTIEFNKVIGNPTLIVPGLPKNYTESQAAWKHTAQIFNNISEKAETQGMRVGYHNHTAEFESLEGEKPFDIFFGNTRKEVVMQLDIGHAVGGGADPVALLKRYPGRAKSVHVKEHSATKHDALIGDGEVKWQDVLTACETIGGTEWYIIEEETGAYPGVEGIEQSLKRLHSLGR
jgi:sugar phosphate isomerase/epimerase